MLTLSFAIPCYNSASYMDKCINSLLHCGDDVEIILVDDGSTKDDTPAKADAWHERYPEKIKVIHQENAGHGGAVNAGLKAAKGLYFKVVDSDDWLDEESLNDVMAYLRTQVKRSKGLGHPTDMVVCNYVYEKIHENTRTVMAYEGVLPENQEFGWKDIGSFGVNRFLLMHSIIYRTQLLKDINLTLPKHTFYVDNIFVYVPLPHVKSIYYLNKDLYRYYIGREGQSVNEKIMKSRIDQQLLITHTMIDSVNLKRDVKNRRLRDYMINYLSMMMCICSVFLRMIGTKEAEAKREEIWSYLRYRQPKSYKAIRFHVLNASTNIPSIFGKAICISGYRIARKLYKFN